jgi:hypothetical protein
MDSLGGVWDLPIFANQTRLESTIIGPADTASALLFAIYPTLEYNNPSSNPLYGWLHVNTDPFIAHRL